MVLHDDIRFRRLHLAAPLVHRQRTLGFRWGPSRSTGGVQRHRRRAASVGGQAEARGRTAAPKTGGAGRTAAPRTGSYGPEQSRRRRYRARQGDWEAFVWGWDSLSNGNVGKYPEQTGANASFNKADGFPEATNVLNLSLSSIYLFYLSIFYLSIYLSANLCCGRFVQYVSVGQKYVFKPRPAAPSTVAGLDCSKSPAIPPPPPPPGSSIGDHPPTGMEADALGGGGVSHPPQRSGLGGDGDCPLTGLEADPPGGGGVSHPPERSSLGDRIWRMAAPRWWHCGSCAIFSLMLARRCRGVPEATMVSAGSSHPSTFAPPPVR